MDGGERGRGRRPDFGGSGYGRGRGRGQGHEGRRDGRGRGFGPGRGRGFGSGRGFERGRGGRGGGSFGGRGRGGGSFENRGRGRGRGRPGSGPGDFHRHRASDDGRSGPGPRPTQARAADARPDALASTLKRPRDVSEPSADALDDDDWIADDDGGDADAGTAVETGRSDEEAFDMADSQASDSDSDRASSAPEHDRSVPVGETFDDTINKTTEAAGSHVDDAEARLEAKRKKRRLDRLRKQAKHKQIIPIAAKVNVAFQPPAIQAAYVWDRYRQTASAWLADLELEPKQLQEAHFIDAASFVDGPHTDAHWMAFLKQVEPKWKKRFAEAPTGDLDKSGLQKGTPRVLIVTSAATRAVDIIRALGEFNQMCRIAKLFAKHFKVPEQMEFLQQHTVRIAVGTPNRLSKLIEEGGLHLDGLSYIVLDCWVDMKERTLFEIPEVRTDLFRFLDDHCMSRVQAGKARFALY